MSVYRIEITLETPLGTPIRSNTLFGHLCWMLRYHDGEGALNQWLQAFEDDPLLLSDAFPHGYVPRPLVRPLTPDEREAWLARAEQALGGRLRAMSVLKQHRKAGWLPLEEFLALRHAYADRVLLEKRLNGGSWPVPATGRSEKVARNRIDRLTGRTPQEGGLYFQYETWFAGEGPHLWLWADPGSLGADRLKSLLELVGSQGYGRDASTGRGRFRIRVEPEPTELFRAQGNRWMTLSRGLLTASMEAARYRLSTHYGRLGGPRASDARGPFKYPLLLVEPGSTFTGGPGPHGGLIRNVHPALSDVVDNGYHLCVAFTEVE